MLLRCCWWLKREEKSVDFQPFFFPLYFCRPLLFSRALFLVTWPSGQNLYPGPYIPWLLLSTLHKNIQLLCNKGKTLICSLFTLPRTFLNPTRPQAFLHKFGPVGSNWALPSRPRSLRFKNHKLSFEVLSTASLCYSFFFLVVVFVSLSCFTIRVQLYRLMTIGNNIWYMQLDN